MKKKGILLLASILLLGGMFYTTGCKGETKQEVKATDPIVSTADRLRHVSLFDVAVDDIPAQTYTGNPVEVNPVLSYGGEALVKDRDYKMECYDNIYPGEATIRIYGLGNYTGVIEMSYFIQLNDSYCDDTNNAKVMVFVEDAYKIFLSRMPTHDELVQFTTGLGGQSIKVFDFLEYIIQSEEYASLEVGDIATIEKIYSLICERNLTDEERTSYATALQSEGITCLSLITEEFVLGNFQKSCEEKGLLAIKLDFSESELTTILDNELIDNWIGGPIFADFNGDGHIEAVREAGRSEANGEVFYFLYTDGYHSYLFGAARRNYHSNTFTYLLENDGGLSFAITSEWETEENGPEIYLSQVFKLDRTEFQTQFAKEYTRILNPQMNSFDIEFFPDEKRVDETGNAIPPQTATLHYADEKYA